MTSAAPIRAAIARSISESKLGYTVQVQSNGDEVTFPDTTFVYVGRSVRTNEIDLSDAYLLEAELAHQGAYVPPTEAPTPTDGNAHSLPVSSTGSASQPITGTPVKAVAPSGEETHYILAAHVDKKQFFKLFRVAQNLTEKADRLLVTIQVEAEADGGFDTVWLRNAVEEPLDEANIDVNVSLE